MYITFWLISMCGCILVLHAAKPRPDCHPRDSASFPQVGDKIEKCFDGCDDCSNCICTENGVKRTANSTCTVNICFPDDEPITGPNDPVDTTDLQRWSPLCHPEGSSDYPKVGNLVSDCFDGCNMCSFCMCTENGPVLTSESQCTKEYCGARSPSGIKPGPKPPNPTCHPKGSTKFPQVGEVIFDCFDGCNHCSTCLCTKDGPIRTPWALCTKLLCFPDAEEGV